MGDKVLLALGNGGNAHQFGDGLGENDLLGEERGDDPYHTASPFKDCTADGAHQPEVAAAVEQRVAALGKELAEVPGCMDILGVAWKCGAAEN